MIRVEAKQLAAQGLADLTNALDAGRSDSLDEASSLSLSYVERRAA
jgi:hypothetical protein